MDFDFTTETITPDASSLLTIGGDGALELPSGITISGALPAGVVAGAVRWNSSLTQVEYNNGGAWINFGGNVTGVSVSSANGFAGTSSGGNTPALTLSTTVTGVLVGNGTSISAANGSTSFPGYAAGIAAGTAGSVLYQTGSNATGFTSVGTAGQALLSGGAASPTWVNSNVTIGSTTVSLGGTSTSLAGVTSLTMAGAINMSTNQINNLGMAGAPAGTDAVNVNYLQSQLSGLSWKQAVKAATAATFTANYANGVSGVGATLTATTNVVLPLVDTISLVVSDRVLVKNQGNTFENGIYIVTSLGAAGTAPWILTRASDSNTAAEVDGSAVYVQQGGTLADTGWTETATMTAIGTGNPIIWAQFSGSGNYAAGVGLTLTGNTFSLTSPVTPSLGGTGTTTAPSAVGQILIATSGNVYTPATITAGTAIGITNASGSVTINNTGVTSNVAGTGISVSSATGAVTITNTGVTSAIGTAGNITVSAATGAVTFNLGTAGTAGTYGTVTTDTFGRVTSGVVVSTVVNGGTGAATLAANGVLLGNGTSAVSATAVGATGQVLVGNTAAAPTWSTLSGIAVTSITGTANQITASASTGAVTLSTPATFIAPGSVAATTTLTVSGNTANSFLYSGTAGLVAATTAPTNGQLLIGSTGVAPVVGTLGVSGTSIYVTNGAGSITLSGPKFYSEFTTAPINAPTATASQAIALGTGSSASIYGVQASANGRFATAGDAQHMSAVLRFITTTAAAGQELFLDGASQRLVIPTNSAWTFSIKITARRTDTTGSYGSWIFNGLIYRDAGVPTVVGLSKTTIARVGIITGAANDPVVSADGTNNSLKVAVSGYAGSPAVIRWVATVDIAQVTN